LVRPEHRRRLPPMSWWWLLLLLLIPVGLSRLRHLPPKTEGPILPGQVWTYVPFNLRWGQRQDRFFVKVLRVENGTVWVSIAPGPQFQNVAKPEAEFRELYRLVPDVSAKPPAANGGSSVIAGDPNLDPKLRARVDAASDVVPVVLEAAQRLRHTDNVSQIYALALHGTIIELFSACVALANWGEPTAIPLVLRSMYEALVDLDNLVHDAGYFERMEAASHHQTLKLMKSGPLREEFLKARKEAFDELATRLAELEAQSKGPLSIRDRCDRVGRLDEYQSLYAMFCLDTHNNASALAERHLTEREDGTPLISFFGEQDPFTIANRLDFGLQFLFQSARMVHGAFQVPAPEVEALAARFETGRRERAAAGGNAAEGGSQHA